MENLNIPEILNHGFKGLGFLLAFLLIRLIYKEQKQKQPRKRILNFSYIFMFFSLVIIVLGFVFELQTSPNNNNESNTTKEKSRLVFIGSGTVCRYLKDEQKEIIENLNIDLFSGPSLTSLHFLANIGIDGHAYNEFIALSSSRIKEKDLLSEETWETFKRGSQYKKIVAIRIAPGYLSLGIRPRDVNKFENILNNVIVDTSLLSVITANTNKDYDIFCTSRQSGTVNEYCKLFKSINEQFSWPFYINFNASSANQEMILNNDKPFIFLGSEYYSLAETKLIRVKKQMDKKHLGNSYYILL